MCLSKLVNNGPALTHLFSHAWLGTYYVQEHAPGTQSTVTDMTEFQWSSRSVEENAPKTTNYIINFSIIIAVSSTENQLQLF